MVVRLYSGQEIFSCRHQDLLWHDDADPEESRRVCEYLDGIMVRGSCHTFPAHVLHCALRCALRCASALPQGCRHVCVCVLLCCRFSWGLLPKTHPVVTIAMSRETKVCGWADASRLQHAVTALMLCAASMQVQRPLTLNPAVLLRLMVCLATCWPGNLLA